MMKREDLPQEEWTAFDSMTQQQRDLCEDLKLTPRKFAVLRSSGGYTSQGHERKNADGLYTSPGFGPSALPSRGLKPLSDLVRLTPGGGKQLYQINGIEILNDQAVRHVDDLGWGDAEWAAAHRDPYVVVEFMTPEGRTIEKGSALAAAASLKAPKANREEDK